VCCHSECHKTHLHQHCSLVSTEYSEDYTVCLCSSTHDSLHITLDQHKNERYCKSYGMCANWHMKHTGTIQASTQALACIFHSKGNLLWKLHIIRTLQQHHSVHNNQQTHHTEYTHNLYLRPLHMCPHQGVTLRGLITKEHKMITSSCTVKRSNIKNPKHTNSTIKVYNMLMLKHQKW
jgi:hypothetical protein